MPTRHGGLDILSVSILLVALASLPPSRRALQLASTVALLPTIAIVYTLLATPFWTPLFLVPAAICFGFAAHGFLLARKVA